MLRIKIIGGLLVSFIVFVYCTTGSKKQTKEQSSMVATSLFFDSTFKTIHVLVALCDNKYQGIVPVPAKIGNGQDADNNLYWGCGYGVRTFFKRSNQWEFIDRVAGNDTIMETLVLKHRTSNYYLVAEAYNGKFIQQCTKDFFRYCAGISPKTLQVKNRIIGTGGNASLIAYIGHDGLMDFALDEKYVNTDKRSRDAIMLACISKRYFATHLQATKASPLLWSTGLMSPEAYTLHDALEAYINGKDVRTAAAKAYSKYQRCSIKAAQNLLVSGW